MTQLTDPVAPHGRRTLALTSLAVLAVFLDTTALFVAFPDIVRTFSSVTPAELSWVLNAYTITVAALLVPAGKVSDRLGHKRMFLTGTAIFTAASLASAMAPNAPMLITFRVVQAIGAAILTPSSLALILRAFAPAQLPAAIAIYGASGAVAAALGPTLGGTVVEFLNWRWVFLINLPIGLTSLWLGRKYLTESRTVQSPLPNPISVITIAAAAALLSLAAVQSDAWGWTGPRTIAAFAAGLLLLVLFVIAQRRSSQPVLNLELFSNRNFAWGNAGVFAFGFAFSAMFLGSILFLTNVWGWSVLKAGFGVAPGPILVALLAPGFGYLAGRIGQRPLLIVGGVAFALAGVWRLLLLTGDPDYLVAYLPSMFLTGLGVALCLPQQTSVVVQSLPLDRLAVGSGVNQAARQFAGTFGVAFTIALIGSATNLEQALAGFDQIWWMLIIGGIATSILAIPLVTGAATIVSPVSLPARSGDTQ